MKLAGQEYKFDIDFKKKKDALKCSKVENFSKKREEVPDGALCLSCYAENDAPNCAQCNQPILDRKIITLKENKKVSKFHQTCLDQWKKNRQEEKEKTTLSEISQAPTNQGKNKKTPSNKIKTKGKISLGGASQQMLNLMDDYDDLGA